MKNELMVKVPWWMRVLIKRGVIPNFYSELPPFKRLKCTGIAGSFRSSRFYGTELRKVFRKEFGDSHSAYVYARKWAWVVDAFMVWYEDVGIYWQVIIPKEEEVRDGR